VKACGVAMAMLPGYSWAARSSTGVVVNVGNGLVLPASPSGEGQVRRRLMAPDRGGGLVVVRARERRAHGEGDQQVSYEVVEDQEVLAGEYQRAGGRYVGGGTTGTGDPGQVAPLGQQ